MKNEQTRTSVRDHRTQHGREHVAAAFTSTGLGELGWARITRHIDSDVLDQFADSRPGRIVRVDRGGQLLVALGGEQPVHVRDRIRAVGACVGDWVLVEHGVAHHLIPRYSVVQRRKDTESTRPQAFAANVDLVLVVESLATGVNVGRLARVIALAQSGGADAAVVLTHADTVEDHAGEAERIAHVTGVDVLATSIVDGRGIDDVRALVGSGATILLIGASGAGKSSLSNVLLGTDVQAVSRTNASGTGRHTTSSAMLLPLPTGGLLIDTPGVRGLGMHGGIEEADAVPTDIDELAADCRFVDCQHDGEPGCAVEAAVERGDLAPDAIGAWRKLRREIRRERARTDHALRSEIKREFKELSRPYVKARRRGAYGPRR